MTATGLRASSSECAIIIPARLRSTLRQTCDNPSFGWPSPTAFLLRPLWLAAAGGMVGAAMDLSRLAPRFFAAPLPPVVQRFKHSRTRAGLTGTPPAFNSSASCRLLQPLRCNAIIRSRNGSNRSTAVFRFFGGSFYFKRLERTDGFWRRVRSGKLY